MNTKALLLLLFMGSSSPILLAEWGAGISGGLFAPPIGFEDPFAFARLGGTYLWRDIPLPCLDKSASLRGELLAGRVKSRNPYYTDSNLIVPGIALGGRRTILAFEGYLAELAGFLGYRHYMREVDFNGEKEEFRTPALTGALELWVDSEAAATTALALEYMLTLESEPRHSLNLLVRLGGRW